MEVDVSNSEASSQTQPQLNMKNPHSLLDLCAHSLATKPHVVQYALDIGLPSKIIIIIYTSAIRYLVSDYHKGLRDSIIIMTSHWPREELSIVDLVGEERGTAVLTGNTGMLLIDWLIEGLLTMRSEAKLRTLDLSGFTASKMFLVPLMWLPPEERTVEVLLNEIHSKYGHFLAAEDDNIETALNWKVSQLENSKLHGRFQGNGPINILVDTEANLSDWVCGVMGDEFFGLIVSDRTPFRPKIRKLAINNFHIRQAQHLRWLLAIMDKQAVRKLGVYGHRKSVATALYNFHDEFKQLSNVTWFAWATSGPRLMRSDVVDDVMFRSVEVLHTWTNLSEMFFNNVTLTNQVAPLLDAVTTPLSILFFRRNYLSRADLVNLANSHHAASLRELTLERMDLHPMSDHVATLAQNAKKLTTLNLQNTNLDEEDKVNVMLALQGSVLLETLVLFDDESFSMSDCYVLIVELACSLPKLQMFYLFPLHYPPLQRVHRVHVEEMCARIVSPGRVEIRVDCQAKVPDWTTMVDALLGLLVSGRTPFTVSIHKLSVNNYHYNYSHRVKWLLSMMDKTSVQRMGLYGYRGSIAQSVHELHKDLKQFQSLTWFAWATCGPKVERDYNCSGPSDQELLIRTADVFHTWSNLTEACFHGVLLTDQLAILLNALPSPLRVLYLVKNELSMRDVDYLAWSHHLDSLRDLTIEKNDLEKMGQYVIELVQNGTSIKFLNLKDDHLLESDKIEIMIGLQGSVILKTLILFDTHSMLTPESYEMIVELACHIKTLKNFYIFPFNHEPFDQVLRKDVTEASAEILLQNNRQDLCLAY